VLEADIDGEVVEEAEFDIDLLPLLDGVKDGVEVCDGEAAGELLGCGDSDAAPIPQIMCI